MTPKSPAPIPSLTSPPPSPLRSRLLQAQDLLASSQIVLHMGLLQGLCMSCALCLECSSHFPPLLRGNSSHSSRVISSLWRKRGGCLRVDVGDYPRGEASRDRRGGGAGLGHSWGGGGWGQTGATGPIVWTPGPTKTLALLHQPSREMQEIFSLQLTLLAKYNSSSFLPCKKHVHQNCPSGACVGGRPLGLGQGWKKGPQGEEMQMQRSRLSLQLEGNNKKKTQQE